MEPEQWLRPATATIVARWAAAGTADCIWTLDGIDQEGRCDGERLVLRRTASDQLVSPLSVRDAVGQSARTCVRIDEKLVIGLGDSYASGEGNPDRPTNWSIIPAVRDAPKGDRRARPIDVLWDRNRRGPLARVPLQADAQWWDNTCHRSLLSQQSLAAMRYAAADPHRIVTFLSFACSGATVIDGIVGPRFEAPGVSRRTDKRRLDTAALQLSQIEQALRLLCAEPVSHVSKAIPDSLEVWRALERPKRPAAEQTGRVRLASCARLRVRPDILLLSIGGNDVGFGGVGFWAIMPSKDRLWLPFDFITGSSVSADRGATKRDFGLVCPVDTNEARCRKSGFTAQRLLGELPKVYNLLDNMLSRSGLGEAPVKIQTAYPPVALDETGELCGTLWSIGTSVINEMRNEPWMPLYAQALDLGRIGTFTPAASIAPWDFGIRNEISLSECLEDDPSKSGEMCHIYRDVYLPLNQAVAGQTARGWTVVDAATLPQHHGLCASSTPLSAAIQAYDGNGDKVQALARAEHGWPRYRDGWLSPWPTPQGWDAYAPRARWYRTATDSALTQTAFDGGTTARNRPRSSRERIEEATSGTIHPTLQMHAAMAEQVAAAMIASDDPQR